MRKPLFAAVCGVFLLGIGSTAAAPNAVGQAVQKLHLSPQQLLSLRDFLSGLEHGVSFDADGPNHFLLRDSVSGGYAGELLLGLSGDGVLRVDRIRGPARLDPQYAVRLPLHMDTKMRAQLAQALAGSQMQSAAGASPAAQAAQPDTVFGINPGNGAAAGTVVVSRAVFFRDGSGTVRNMRLAPGEAGPTRVADRYFSPIESDGAQVWRESVVEIDTALQVALKDLQARACPAADACKPRPAAAAPGGRHVIRWTHELVAAVPPSLLARLVPKAAGAITANASGQAAAGNQSSVSAAPVIAPGAAAVPQSVAGSPDSGGR